MAKVASAGLAKTLPGEIEFFMVGSLYGERIVCLRANPSLSPGYGRERLGLILLWRNVHRGGDADLFRALFSWAGNACAAKFAVDGLLIH